MGEGLGNLETLIAYFETAVISLGSKKKISYFQQ